MRILGCWHGQHGRHGEALALAKQAVRASEGDSVALLYLSHACKDAGDDIGARIVAEQMVARYAEWPDAFVRFRRETVDLIRRRWALLTAAAIAGNLAVFAVLLVSLRAVGIDSSEITATEAFAGWSLARVLQLIPLTPGGVGPVELGLTGILVGLGGPNAEVVAAVLLYRAATVIPTLLLGLATIGAWRWLGPGRSREGVEPAAGNPPGG